MKRFCSRLFPGSLTFNKLYVGAREGQEPPQSWQGYWQRQEAGQRAPPHQQSPPGPPSPPSLPTPPRVLLPHQCFEALLGSSAMLRPTGLQLLWDTFASWIGLLPLPHIPYPDPQQSPPLEL